MAHRLPFSPWYRFRATRPLVFEGRAYTYNEAIPPDMQARMSERLLRQLYEQRRIEPLPIEMPGPLVSGDGSVGPVGPKIDSGNAGPAPGSPQADSDLAEAQRLHAEGVARRSRRKPV